MLICNQEIKNNNCFILIVEGIQIIENFLIFYILCFFHFVPTDTWPNGHLVDPTFGRTDVWSIPHLAERTFGRSHTWQNGYVRITDQVKTITIWQGNKTLALSSNVP